MNNKISDFKLAESVLKYLCRKNNVNFIDVPIWFDIGKHFDNNKIIIKNSNNVAHTIYIIISNYINNSVEIVGKELFINKEKKESFLINLVNSLRNIIYAEDVFFNNIEELTLQRLYTYPLVWTLIRDIICPLYNIAPKNIKVVTGDSPYIDISKYYEEGEIKKDDKINYPFIFVNKVDDLVVLNAFLFVEALKAHDLSPIEIIKYIFESSIYDKFKGLLKMSFDSDKKVEDFISMLIYITGINLRDFISQKVARTIFDIKKFSQINSPDTASQFWYLGVIDRMLETVRGADWSTYEALNKYNEDLWTKVEEIKKKRKKNKKDVGVPFNILLRLRTQQTGGDKIDSNKIMQELLSSNRVW